MRKSYYLLTLIATIFAISLFFTFVLTPNQSEEGEAEVWHGHESAVTDLSISPKGDYVVSSGLDGTVRLWDTSTGQSVHVFRSHTDEVYKVAFSSDGHRIVSTGYDRQIIVSEVSGKTVHRLSGFLGWSVSFALSPDSNQLAAWSMDGGIWIWDLESGRHISTLEGKKWIWGMALAWSPDGRYLACGRSEIVLWDVKTGQQIKSLQGHRGFVRSLAFSPEGRFLASASMDKTACIWNVESGELFHKLEPEGFVHYTRSGPVTNPIRVPVTAVAFSPDSRTLVTGGADRIVRLWDAETGKLIRKFLGHTMTVTAVAFSPDSKQLVSSSLDHTIRLWKLD